VKTTRSFNHSSVILFARRRAPLCGSLFVVIFASGLFAQTTISVPSEVSSTTTAKTGARIREGEGQNLPVGSQLNSMNSTVTTTINRDGTTNTTAQQTPNGVEVEVGVVTRMAGSTSGYNTNNGVLSLTNVGRATPQFLTGLGFSCDTATTTTAATKTTGEALVSTSSVPNTPFCNTWAKRLGAFVAVQMGSGTNQTISGYSVGMTVAVINHLRILAGFSMSPINQISPGFANAAAQYVTKNPTLFPAINPASLASNAPGAFDGIQTTTTAPASGAAPTSTIYYPGSPTETSYKPGFIIGVSLPINIFNLIGGNSKSN
jgi:hypothetical protein